MKLAFICAGDIQIPPPSWGAVEILVWEYFNNLKEIGVDARIYNSKDLNWVLSEINKEKFDFVHLQHEDYLPYIKFPNNNFAVTAHCGWAENYKYYEAYYWKTFKSILKTNGYIFALSEKIKKNYIDFGVKKDKIFVTKNGVNTEKYRKTFEPIYKDRSIYLGKIENRKRQHVVSNMELNIDFAGFGNELKISNSNKLLGTWSKDDVYNKMTDYANLILLSISEAHPLVCMEALSSGLGLVISEKSSANLDLNKKFISVIPEAKINDFDFLKKSIEENRRYSIQNRQEILNYSKEFDWKSVTKNYLNLIQELVNK